MKRLAVLSLKPTHIDRYILIRDSKHNSTRKILQNNHSWVLSRYDELAASMVTKTPEAVLVFKTTNDVKSAFETCYDVETIELRKLKADIKRSQRSHILKYCPLCETTLPLTFDHCLPISKFPEFSVNAGNLSPCCSTCNSIKGDKWTEAKGGRCFLHPYVDDVPDVPFLKIKLFTFPPSSAVGAVFTLDGSQMEPGTWRLIESHFKSLKLLERYNDLGNDEITEMLLACKAHREAGGIDIRAFMSKMHAFTEGVFGVNNWRAQLMSVLMSYDGLEQLVDST